MDDTLRPTILKWENPSPMKNSIATFSTKLKLTVKDKCLYFLTVLQWIDRSLYVSGLDHETEESIAWDKQDPELFGGDIMLTGRKHGILTSGERWPDATIPYVISSSYSIYTLFLFRKQIWHIILQCFTFRKKHRDNVK